jgi:hypothetical protein
MRPIISGGNDAFEKSFISVSILFEEHHIAPRKSQPKPKLLQLALADPALNGCLMARGHQADVENRQSGFTA